MKHFMIRYQFANGTPEEWHREVGRFISALDGDPELKGKIGYRVMKNRDNSSYFHLAAAADEQAVKTLQSAGLLQALHREDEAGRRRRGHGHADRTDCGNGAISVPTHFFIPGCASLGAVPGIITPIVVMVSGSLAALAPRNDVAFLATPKSSRGCAARDGRGRTAW